MICIKEALNKASASVFSANWASESALHDYKVNPEKIYTIPLGANLETIPYKEEVYGWIAERSHEKICQFLFLGINWKRKGWT